MIDSPLHFFGNTDTQKYTLKFLPTTALLRLHAAAFQNKNELPSALKEREAILIEFFSRHENEEDIQLQINFFNRNKLELFKETLSNDLFRIALKKALLSKNSTLEHKLAVITAWNGNKPALTLIKTNKSQSRLKRDALSLKKYKSQTEEDKLEKIKTKLDLRSNDIKTFLQYTKNQTIQNLIHDLMKELNHNSLRKIFNLLENLDTHYIKKIKGLFSPILAQFARNIHSDECISAVALLIPALEQEEIKTFITMPFVQHCEKLSPQYIIYFELKKFMPVLRQLGFTDKQAVHTACARLFPHLSEDHLFYIAPMLSYNQLQESIFNRMDRFIRFAKSDIHRHISEIWPYMKKTDIQNYSDLICDYVQHQDTIEMGLEALLSFLKNLKESTDFDTEPFINLLLNHLSSINWLHDTSMMTLQCIHYLLQHLNNADHIFIIKTALLAELEKNEYERLIEDEINQVVKITEGLLKKPNIPGMDAFIYTLLTKFYEVPSCDLFNFFGRLVINNKTSLEFQQFLINTTSSNKHFEDLQIIQEAWKHIQPLEPLSDISRYAPS